jgi:hypothetical protein
VLCSPFVKSCQVVIALPPLSCSLPKMENVVTRQR